MDAEIMGGCLCGACRYATDAAPINVRACHCRRCQKATGAPLYARVMVPLDTVRVEGPIAWFDAGTGVRRGFCPRCGTTLFSERAEANTVGLTMGSLDAPDRFVPTDHIFFETRQKWLKLAGDTPRHPGLPPGTPPAVAPSPALAEPTPAGKAPAHHQGGAARS